MRDGYDILEKEKEFFVRVWGGTERELFSRALLGLAAVMRPDLASGGKLVSLRLYAHGENLRALLQKFLSQVIFESEMHNAIFSAMNVIELTLEEIECELIGKGAEHFEEEVIGIEPLRLERLDGGRWEAEFVLR